MNRARAAAPLGALVALVALVWASSRQAGAQQPGAQAYDDPLSPIRCFQIADDANLASLSAVELCTGATSEAPARCFTEAQQRTNLSDQQAQALCTLATSTAPVDCWERLDQENTLANEQLVSYCRTSCPYGPSPPQSSDPGCLADALTIPTITWQQATALCTGARSTAPAQCYRTAEAEIWLPVEQQIALCAPPVGCQYAGTLNTSSGYGAGGYGAGGY
ncbi:MAG: hypothetical protein ACTHU0_05450 [Kofleriaceae bacterium]